MPPFLDLTGQRFGRLTVLKFMGKHRYGIPQNSTAMHWRCQCECGSIYDTYRTGNLRSGRTTQCRICGLATMHATNRTHGKSRTSLYQHWKRLKAKGHLYREWERFEDFCQDVGDHPGPGYFLMYPCGGRPLGPGARWMTYCERDAKHFARLTGQDKEGVMERFQRITKQRRYQLLRAAEKNCLTCGGIPTHGRNGKACRCKGSHTGGRKALPIPDDFEHNCAMGTSVQTLAQEYGVCSVTIYKWIKALGLKRILMWRRDEKVAAPRDD